MPDFRSYTRTILAQQVDVPTAVETDGETRIAEPGDYIVSDGAQLFAVKRARFEEMGWEVSE